MNYLVFLDSQAGELEKILSGTKSMLVKEFDPARPAAGPVSPGDHLYFMRNREEGVVRVKATVLRVRFLTKDFDEGLSQALKEMQSRLQLTEDQYNGWSVKDQVVLVEFSSAQKINPVSIAPGTIPDRSGWIAFEELSQIA